MNNERLYSLNVFLYLADPEIFFQLSRYDYFPRKYFYIFEIFVTVFKYLILISPCCFLFFNGLPPPFKSVPQIDSQRIH